MARYAPTVMIIDEDELNAGGLVALAERAGFDACVVSSVARARATLARELPEVVLVSLEGDEPASDLFGPELLGRSDLIGAVEVLQVASSLDPETVRRGMQLGASDYFLFPREEARLGAALEEIYRCLDARLADDAALAEVQRRLLGESPAVRRMHRFIAKVAPTEATVLLVGETGTGKELVAATLHALSPRREGPLEAVNCGAIASELVESELFGHAKGAFTGAARRHRGFFERAAGGTLFLDEITETPQELQVKLLRVLESGDFRPVGAEQDQQADVRLVASTNRDPQDAVAESVLREDLYYRLAQVPISVPPLRDRGEDVILLAEHFLAERNAETGTSKHLSDAARDLLRLHDWPGNVRELRNAILRGHILAGVTIEPDDLPGNIPSRVVDSGDTLRVSVGSSLKDVERRLILATLEACSGDKPQAAEILGVSLKTLYNRLKQYREE